jgi:hypothetical protein
MVSAGSAGTPSTTVSSPAGRALSVAVPLPEASCLPPAGVPFGETPPPAVPSDAVSSLAAGAGLAGCLLRDCRGGAMMSLVRASWSSMRLSSEAREVTTVGEPLREPSGLSVRLSKPSSL